MTIGESLKSINAYPIPAQMFATIAARRGLNLSGEFTGYVAESSAYRLATADVYAWLAVAPNVSQGGQSYSFDNDTRANFLSISNRIYGEFGEESSVTGTKYGYKGRRI